jgi:hypothetical protein
MASAMVHRVIDLLAFGRHHFDLHRQKDAPAATLGIHHREVHHQWYKVFPDEWDFDTPFPALLHRTIEHAANDEEAEQLMSFVGHDYVDRVWDSVLDERRRYIEGLFIWVLLQPGLIKEEFGVDAYGEKIARTIDGATIWDDAPGLQKEYARLRAYAKRVLERDPALQRVLERFGQ